MHRTRTPCLPSAIVIDGLRSRCAGHLAIYFPLPVFFAPTRRTNSAVVIYPRNKGASEQVAQCAMASAFDSGMGFMGIFLPRGVINHSISSPQPRQDGIIVKPISLRLHLHNIFREPHHITSEEESFPCRISRTTQSSWIRCSNGVPIANHVPPESHQRSGCSGVSCGA